MRTLVVREFGKASLGQPLLLKVKKTKDFSLNFNELVISNKDQIWEVLFIF